ncbi:MULTISPECIES: GNAT family N-acetyltransferase [Pedobacter]|uniref:GCN5-related N-acetyltransferase n=1 Tax=Pedobacter heparinus (strain ATCC 13125 / DSM 2366 / CIP 104194 / JCM 7457 / NBRC 12017 / NCIMB 9290 / NRRL B-14731 / HIM 762-3) TaxID=485917 RepID=C6XUJ6_PEDHD|nr:MULTISPECIES: GNAT family N-acetyltransferase [Pedobacter]ACU03846.1 GCN5-related N-acetyltransferase [Pedobacter heparinus DSM 2366]MBB5436632.1 N-acetylglutamate synthase-like GNAT family acetyltransferase [Pedobacter sp. AK017]
MEIEENGFVFSDDKNKIDPIAIHHYLSTQSYWAKDIPIEIVKTSIENSLCFGIYKDSKQVGFARWITDKATFGYLADVYVDEAYRGQGLSKKLMSLMLFHKDLQGLRRYMLATLDAHGLYAQFGFKAVEHPERIMGIAISNPYQKQD